MRKRVLSMLLALCMALSLLPGAALAEDEGGGVPVTPEIQIVQMKFSHPDSSVITNEALTNFTAGTATVPYLTESVVLWIRCVTPDVVFKTTQELWDTASEIRLSGGGCGMNVIRIEPTNRPEELLLYLEGSAKEGALEISIGAGFFAESSYTGTVAFTDSNAVQVVVPVPTPAPAPAPAVKTTPAVRAEPDFIEGGAQKVVVRLTCATEGVSLDWRPLERILYGDGADASGLTALIGTNAADAGLQLTDVAVDWDNEAAPDINDSAYPYDLYPQGVCPVTSLLLTFEGSAIGGALQIQLAGELFLRLVSGNSTEILTHASRDLFNPVSVTIPIQAAANPEGAELTVQHENGEVSIRVNDVAAAGSGPVQIGGVTGDPGVFYITAAFSVQALDALCNGPTPVQVNTDLGAVLLSGEAIAEVRSQLGRGREAELTISWDADAVRMARGRVSQAEAVSIEFWGMEISGLSQSGRLVIGILTSIKDPAVFRVDPDGAYVDMHAEAQGELAVFATDRLATFVAVPRSEAEKLTGAAQTGGDGGASQAKPETPAEETPDAPDAPVSSETPASPETPAEAAPAEAAPLPFTDVAETAWYYDAVRYVCAHQMMNGDGSPTLFNPDGATTRAMLVTILYRLEGEPEAGAYTFPDVPAGSWYADAVAWAAEQAIVGGRGDGFDPMGLITRQDFATILYRYAAFKGLDVSVQGDLSAFPDADSVSAYARQAVAWANALGLINGSGGLLEPAGTARRAQAAAILFRFCGQMG